MLRSPPLRRGEQASLADLLATAAWDTIGFLMRTKAAVARGVRCHEMRFAHGFSKCTDLKETHPDVEN
jgi:hypothetical protein